MEKVINKSEFIAELATQTTYLSSEIVEEATHKILGLMADTLCKDGRIEVRGFGSFSLHHRAPRIARNPKTGEQVTVEAKAIPYFKPGKALRENVNHTDGT